MIHADIVGRQPPLTRLEWRVVALAIREAGDARVAGSGAAGRFTAWLWRQATGTPPVRPLGDPRLDALRRFVSVSRQGRTPAPALSDELAGFGYTSAQLAALARLA